MDSMGLLPGVVSAASAVVWDFDGVVADTEPTQAAAYEVVLARRGVTQPAGWFGVWVGTPEQRIWGYLRNKFSLPDSVTGLVNERADVYGSLASKLHPAWFVEPVLALPCPHRIVSAGNFRQIDMLLATWGLKDAFVSVSAVGAPSGDRRPKVERLTDHLTPGTVLFEDSARYLAAAAGYTRVGVHHRFNCPDELSCELFVKHSHRGVWYPAGTHTRKPEGTQR